MKLIVAVGALAASALADDRGLSGWDIECKVDTDQTEAGPAFLYNDKERNGELNLYWSSFGRDSAGVYGNGPFGVKDDLTSCSSVSNDTQIPLIDAEYLKWPNEMVKTPPSIFGRNDYLAVANGFPPVANDGCIAIADMQQPFPVGQSDIQIVTGGCGCNRVGQTKYFYHTMKWFDMDGDGDLDILTARASSRLSPTDLAASELVWFENPGDQSFQPGCNAWKSYEIQGGNGIADVYLDVFLNSNGNDNIVVVVGGFASRTLSIIQGPVGAWGRSQGRLTQTIVDNDGYYFYQMFDDLNQDGVPDLLVTIGSYGEKQGQLVIYQGSITPTGGYSVGNKKVIYNQFPVFNSAGLGSPGFARPFYYSKAGARQFDDEKYPNILVNGDDDGNLYLFTANYEDNAAMAWGNYTYSKIYQTAAFNPFVTPFNAPTLGKETVIDINNDGCNEIILPNYSTKQLVVLEQRDVTKCKRFSNRPTLKPPTEGELSGKFGHYFE